MTVTSTRAADDHRVPSAPDESKEATLLLAAEGAVDAGARVMRSARSHIGAVVATIASTPSLVDPITLIVTEAM